MSDERTNLPERSDQLTALMGWLKEFFGQFELAWQLLWDGRVPVFTKIVPLLTMVYLLSPMDLIPDLALGLGQLDDLAILLVGLRLFIDICPPELVAEHRDDTGAKSPDAVWLSDDGPVIDLEAEIVPDDEEEPSTEA